MGCWASIPIKRKQIAYGSPGKFIWKKDCCQINNYISGTRGYIDMIQFMIIYGHFTTSIYLPNKKTNRLNGNVTGITSLHLSDF